MARLLVSVTNPHEAAQAAGAGADWVDLKDPSKGSLGMVDPRVVVDSIDALEGRVPVSVALGELLDADRVESLHQTPLASVSRVKIGLAGTAPRGTWQSRWREKWQGLSNRLPNTVGLVAVHYADWQHCDAPRAEQVLEAARQISCPAFLIDTYSKQGSSLIDHYPLAELVALGHQVNQAGMEFVVAGNLNMQHLADVVAAGADVVAVRGAVCEQSQRTSRLSPSRVVEMKSRLSELGKPAMRPMESLGG